MCHRIYCDEKGYLLFDGKDWNVRQGRNYTAGSHSLSQTPVTSAVFTPSVPSQVDPVLVSPSEAVLEPPLQQAVWDGQKPLPVSGQDLVIIRGHDITAGQEELLQKAICKRCSGLMCWAS